MSTLFSLNLANAKFLSSSHTSLISKKKLLILLIISSTTIVTYWIYYRNLYKKKHKKTKNLMPATNIIPQMINTQPPSPSPSPQPHPTNLQPPIFTQPPLRFPLYSNSTNNNTVTPMNSMRGDNMNNDDQSLLQPVHFSPTRATNESIFALRFHRIAEQLNNIPEQYDSSLRDIIHLPKKKKGMPSSISMRTFNELNKNIMPCPSRIPPSAKPPALTLKSSLRLHPRIYSNESPEPRRLEFSSSNSNSSHREPGQKHITLLSAVDEVTRTKLIIVCYKLPLVCSFNSSKLKWEFEWQDVRNIFSNLRFLESSHTEINFVGWPGITPDTLEEQESMADELEHLEHPCYPVWLSPDLYKNACEIFCGKMIWPLFHYMMPTNDYQFGDSYDRYWQAYIAFNSLYAKQAANTTDRDESAVIWFHDYHLLMAAHILRKKMSTAQIGFFLHACFPTSEVFRCLPTRREILRGMLSVDLLGFHTYDYARHFLSAVKRIMHLDYHTKASDGMLAVHYLGRDISLSITHTSIPSKRILRTSKSRRVKNIAKQKWKQMFGTRKIILSVSELDIVRGTMLSLRAFHQFLTRYPNCKNEVVFVVVLLPSSSLMVSTPFYNNYVCELKTDDEPEPEAEAKASESPSRAPEAILSSVKNEIHEIQQQFGRDCILLIDENLHYHQLLALYTITDVGLFGTFWDGFNTTPYQFIAANSPNQKSRTNSVLSDYESGPDSMLSLQKVKSAGLKYNEEMRIPPAIIVSEFMGCMRTLSGVFRVNPWQICTVADTINTALAMTEQERRFAHYRRSAHVMKYTFEHWAKTFVRDLKKAAFNARSKRVLPIGFGSNVKFIYVPNGLQNLRTMQKLFISSLRTTTHRIFLFDYGGTLTDVNELQTQDEDQFGQYGNRLAASTPGSPSSPGGSTDRAGLRELLGIHKQLQKISPYILGRIRQLSETKQYHNTVAIISGQTTEILDRAFPNCPNICMAAEKGAFFRWPGSDRWIKNDSFEFEEVLQWKEVALDVLRSYTSRTSGSYLEVKRTALVWHYHDVDPMFGDIQAMELVRYLGRTLRLFPNVAIQQYDHSRLIEVLPKSIHKGTASLIIIDHVIREMEVFNQRQQEIYKRKTNQYIQQRLQMQQKQQKRKQQRQRQRPMKLKMPAFPIQFDTSELFMLAVGNDRTDEKMFASVELAATTIKAESHFYTVRIGMGPTHARFYLTAQAEMVWLFDTLYGNSKNTVSPTRSPTTKRQKLPGYPAYPASPRIPMRMSVDSVIIEDEEIKLEEEEAEAEAGSGNDIKETGMTKDFVITDDSFSSSMGVAAIGYDADAYGGNILDAKHYHSSPNVKIQYEGYSDDESSISEVSNYGDEET